MVKSTTPMPFGTKTMGPNNTLCDTNILLDHLLGRSHILTNLLAKNITVHFPLPVWLETIYVLETVFKQKPTSISTTLNQILITQGINCPKTIIHTLLTLYQYPPFTSIIDCYLIYFASFHQLSLTTKDKKLQTKYAKTHFLVTPTLSN
jgi:predicted nucleic acid-binding protein